MKKLITIFTLLFISYFLLAQAPNLFNYQAVIRDNTGQVISNSTIQLRISILMGDPNGLIVYQEIHQTSTNSNGLITLKIGSGNILTGSMEDINWLLDEFFIRIEVDETNTNEFTEVSTTQLLSVPYADAASVANSVVLNSPNGTKYELKVDDNGWLYPEEIAEFECGDPLIDERDGHVYGTILIGSECWMSSNLNIGEMIPGDSDMQNNGIIEKYCYDDDPANCETYGGLYKWDEMMQYQTQEGIPGICPSGWYLPTDMDWYNLVSYVDTTIHDTIEDYLGITAGGDLKSTMFWEAPNTGATDKYGFSAIPSGFSFINAFNSINESTIFSSSSSFTTGSSTFYYGYNLNHNSAKVNRDSYPIALGSSIYAQSVRCKKHVDLIYFGIEYDNSFPFADQDGAYHAFHDTIKSVINHNGNSPNPLNVPFPLITSNPLSPGFSWLLVPANFDQYIYAKAWNLKPIDDDFFHAEVTIYGADYHFYKIIGTSLNGITWTGRGALSYTFYTEFPY
jgi:uncharacterized protein (TIGR02145 family)